MKTILVVDDSVINLKNVKRTLSDKYKVVPVSSAKDGLAFLKIGTPDLILLDVMMPEMDGLEMMEILSGNDQYRKIPVVFLTANEDSEREDKGIKMGARDFIRKPIEPQDMIDRISKILE